MLDARHAELIIVSLGSLVAFLLTADACRRASKRGALEWRRGRLLYEAHHPRPFRLGLSLMQSASLGFAFGAFRAATVFFDVAR